MLLHIDIDTHTHTHTHYIYKICARCTRALASLNIYSYTHARYTVHSRQQQQKHSQTGTRVA
jgi:hypothetical protein